VLSRILGKADTDMLGKSIRALFSLGYATPVSLFYHILGKAHNHMPYISTSSTHYGVVQGGIQIFLSSVCINCTTQEVLWFV
jgi:hypothetical protein